MIFFCSVSLRESSPYNLSTFPLVQQFFRLSFQSGLMVLRKPCSIIKGAIFSGSKTGRCPTIWSSFPFLFTTFHAFSWTLKRFSGSNSQNNNSPNPTPELQIWSALTAEVNVVSKDNLDVLLLFGIRIVRDIYFCYKN